MIMMRKKKKKKKEEGGNLHKLRRLYLNVVFLFLFLVLNREYKGLIRAGKFIFYYFFLKSKAKML